MAAIAAGKKAAEKILTIPNTPKGRQEFLAQLAKFNFCLVAIESTGGWATPLDQQLLAAGHQVVTIHPLRLARARELYGQSHKTDAKDAALLLWMVKQLHGGQIISPQSKRLRKVLPCPSNLIELKELSRHYHAITWEVQRHINRLNRLIFVYLPTLQTVFKQAASVSCLAVLSHTACPSTWQLINRRTLSGWIRRYCGNGHGPFVAGQLKNYAAGRDWEILPPAISLELKQLAQFILLLRQQQVVVKDRLELLLDQLPEAKALMTLPGCGIILAAAILAELSPIERFPSHNQVAMYAGLTRVRHESGLSKSSRSSKLVNRRAKWAFRQLLMLNARFCPLSKQYIQKHLDRGRTVRQAKLSLGRQLVKVTMALIKTKQPFNPDRQKVA